MLFGNEEAALVILPAYHLGRLNTRERYFIPAENGYDLEDKSSAASTVSFWNFSVGVQGDFFGLDDFSFAGLLTYTTLDSEQAFSELDGFEKNYSGGSSDGIGMSVRVFYHLF